MSRIQRAFDNQSAVAVPTLRHDIFTFQDVVEQLLFENDLQREETSTLAKMRTAVIHAYRELPNYADWLYYKRVAQIRTEAVYSEGSVDYDHTGGTYERELTLTGGVWPENAALGVVFLGNVHYQVESRVSDTVITLRPDSNPGEDVADQQYKWYRDSYPLPLGYRSSGKMVDATDQAALYPLEFVPPEAHLSIQRDFFGSTTNRPEWWTIRSDGRYLSGLAIIFGRPPNVVRTYEFTYNADGQRLHTEKYSDGLVTTAGTTVTGTDTNWNQQMVGSIIRFSGDDQNEPTGVGGYFSQNGGEYNPYVDQRTVMQVTSGTELVVDAPVGSLAGVRYTISDPIDLDTGAMYSAFLALVRRNWARIDRKEGLRTLEQEFAQELALAKEADYRPRVVQPLGLYSLGGFRIGHVNTVP
jgi:hypothetical protein